MAVTDYERFLRERITELRIERNVSEYRMSLELGKSGSYIRSITSGASLPSLREFFNIIDYLEISPYEFFASLSAPEDPRTKLCERIRSMNDEDVEKMSVFIGWLEDKK